MSAPNGAPQNDQSDDAVFRAAFDRKGPNFHKGDPTAVPIGGGKIPKGMEAHADWMSLPVVDTTPPPPQDFGPEVVRLTEERRNLIQLKKLFSGVTPSLAAVVRFQGQLEAAEEDQKKKLNALIKREKKKVAAAVEKLRGALKDFPEDTQNGKDIIAMADRASKDLTAEEHAKFVEDNRHVTQRVFGSSQRMMQTIKAAKKAYLAEKKEEKKEE